MKERPIPFSGGMVRALLAGTKTQTRRLVRPQPSAGLEMDLWTDLGRGWGGVRSHAGAQLRDVWRCPYGQPGDRLWVRETWALEDCGDDGLRLIWAADRAAVWVDASGAHIGEIYYLPSDYKPERWRPSIHMPQWASRLTLEVTGVRVEWACEISEADAVAEGIAWQQNGSEGAAEWGASSDTSLWRPDPVSAFRALLESLYGPDAWETWVWAVSFRVVR